MNAIRAGVIGVGYLGKFHAEKYAALPGIELVGVVDADSGRAKLLAEQLKTESFTDPRRLIGRVDAVSIVVPTVHHHSLAKLFLEAGVHVLLEKPMTVTVGQADELIGLSRARGRVLQIGHIERYNPALTGIRPLIRKPKHLFAERAAPFTVRCTDVSVVLDLMIHDIDIIADLAGSQPCAVSSAGAAIITDKIDLAAARILFQNGCVADIVASRVSDEKKRILRVLEQEQVIIADYQTQQSTILRRITEPVPGMHAQPVAAERRDTLADEIQAFIACVQKGEQPLVSGTEGRRALALAAVVEESILAGRTEFVSVSA